MLHSPAVSQTAPAVGSPVYMLCERRFQHDLNEACMLVNAAGNRLTPQLFNTPDTQPHDGMLRTVKRVPDVHGGEWQYGFINTQGQEILPAAVRKKDGLNALTSANPARFNNQHELNKFSEGLALVCDRQHGCGYVGTDGGWVIAARTDWTQAHDFHHGLALVRGPGYTTDSAPMSSVGPQHIQQTWSVIDKTGRIVMGYDLASEKNTMPSQEELLRQRRYNLFTLPEINIQSDFKDGYAMFSRVVTTKTGHDTAYGMVDTQGRIVVPATTQYSREGELRKKYAPAPKSNPATAMNEERWMRVGESYQYLAKVSRFTWTKKQAEVLINGRVFIDVQARVKAEAKHAQQKLKLVTPFEVGHAVVEIYDPQFDYTEALMDTTGRIVAIYKKLAMQVAVDKK